MAQIGTKGAELDLLIRQGATFGPNSSRILNPNGTPVDLTGATIRAQIRKTPNSTLSPGATAVFTITNATNGQFNWEFSASDTTLLTADASGETAAGSQYVWDMELQDSTGRVLPLLYGKVSVYREVTKVDP